MGTGSSGTHRIVQTIWRLPADRGRGTCDSCGKERHSLYGAAYDLDGVPTIMVCYFCIKRQIELYRRFAK